MKSIAFLFSLLYPVSSAVAKDPGEGGKAEIRGRVYRATVQLHRTSHLVIPIRSPDRTSTSSTVMPPTGQFPDDNVDTGPDGTFRFKWLRKGSYTYYTISECNTCASGEKACSAAPRSATRRRWCNVGDLLIDELLRTLRAYPAGRAWLLPRCRLRCAARARTSGNAQEVWLEHRRQEPTDRS